METQEIKKQRNMVIQEALSWRGTPYHLNAAIKGIGVDCGTFLTSVFAHAGLIEPVDLGSFKPDFHLHRSEQVYQRWLMKYCKRAVDMESCKPGDIVLYQFGRISSHGALVTDPGRIIHAYSGIGVIESGWQEGHLDGRITGFYSFWED
jgi:cell wall-associated NlpC family hydrolase